MAKTKNTAEKKAAPKKRKEGSCSDHKKNVEW